MTLSRRFFVVCAAALALLAGLPASAYAAVVVTVYKSTQRMSVAVDGTPRYNWAVSTGRAGYGTPNGMYSPTRLERSWFSREYYNSPMPHSIFFHGGYAIHGSYEISRLGGPASHGCIRLHPSNAATLFALVQQEGTGATTIVVSGESGAVAGRRSPAIQTEDNFFERGFFTPGNDSRSAPGTGYQRQPRGFFEYSQ